MSWTPDIAKFTGTLSWPHTCLALAAAALVYFACWTIYNLHFSPLRVFPGPRLWAVTKVPFNWHTIRGTSAIKFKELHHKYGEVVRYAPNALAYIGPESWDEIYGPYNGKKHMEMDPKLFGGNVTVTGALQITNAVDDDHRRLRNRFSRALSAKAVAAQEPVLRAYVHLFIDGIRQELAETPSATIDIAKWFSLATFDVISKLAFGDDFDGLATGKYHPWVSVVFGAFKALPFLRVLREFPGMLWIGNHATWLLPKKLKKMWYDHFDYAFGLMEQRFKNPKEKKDLIYYIFEGADNDLTKDEIKESAAQLVMAGSEPTATFLAGLVYYLGLNPTIYENLKSEMRASFQASDEMTVASLARLPYFSAVIQEGLRLFPPAPDIFPRIVPKGGEVIMGKYLPEGTQVGIAALAASHSATNFDDPSAFRPERWLDESATADKRMKACCPFGQGHRSCLGKTLAYAEIRLLTASLLWNFEVELHPDDRDWVNRCKVFLGWEKPPLRIILRAREIAG